MHSMTLIPAGKRRTLICKVEEIHTTLRKHLAKEEEQLLPLLLLHFSSAEQAELVAQFLYSIPLETVERVLSQLKPLIPRVCWLKLNHWGGQFMPMLVHMPCDSSARYFLSTAHR